MKNKGLYMFGALLVVCLLLTGLAVSQSRSVRLNLPEENLSKAVFCINYWASPDNYIVEDQAAIERIVLALNQLQLKEITEAEAEVSFNQRRSQTLLLLIYGNPTALEPQIYNVTCSHDGMMFVSFSNEQGGTYYSGADQEQLVTLLQEIVEEQQPRE